MSNLRILILTVARSFKVSCPLVWLGRVVEKYIQQACQVIIIVIIQ